MATGRADFWYGRPFMVTDTPDEFNTQDAPTANWAYNHGANSSAHHARYADAEAVLAMGSIGNLNPLNHNRYSGGEAQEAMGVKADSNPFHHDKTVSADIDHGGVAGLADDDHPQYLHTSIVRDLSTYLRFNDTVDMLVVRTGGSNKFILYSNPGIGVSLGLYDVVNARTLFWLDGDGNMTVLGSVTAGGFIIG